MNKRNGKERNIFAELMEGVGAMGERRAGKVTLRTHSLPPPEVKEAPGAEFFVAARERFNVSRAVWQTCCASARARLRSGNRVGK